MASISSLGLSGLPLTDLLTDLRKVEEAPLSVLATRMKSYETRVSSYGTLSNALATFQTTAKALGEVKTFGSFKSTSSNAETLAVSTEAGSAAVAGTYAIHVDTLASTQSLATAGLTNRTEALSANGGTITFTLGDSSTKTLELEAGQTSVESLRAAINSADLGISATIINNGDDNTPFQLTLSTNDTGTAASIAGISVDNAELQSVLGYDAGTPAAGTVTEVREAANAMITVNGIAVTSQSNTLKDAIEGVTLTLNATTEANKPVTVTVDKNTALTHSAIQNFVSTYNALQTTIRSLTSYNIETQTSSALTGDSVARSVQTQMQSVLSGAIDNEGQFAVLAQMGIRTNVQTGQLEIDTDTLNAALADNLNDVQAFFTGDQGLAARLNQRIEPLLGGTGAIANASNGAKTTIKDLEKQYVAMQTRVDARMATYQAQFVALEKVMAQMSSTSSYLTTQLSMLESMGKSNNGQ
ncbi:MAG: flagellar filament capping protein FliD [Pigmentiphaga sp.]